MKEFKVEEIVLRVMKEDKELTKSKTYDEAIDNFSSSKNIIIIESKLILTSSIFKDYNIKFYRCGS